MLPRQHTGIHGGRAAKQTHEKGRRWKADSGHPANDVPSAVCRPLDYPWLMKKLILVAVVAAIAAVLYKVLTTEIPIDDA